MLDFKSVEERVLKLWDDRDIFVKSMRARLGAKPFVFFEGPPFANGNPGIHHFIGRVFKDLFCRYQTMRGRYVLRKGGWDTHGLPVELQVEKELGFKSKKDIEAYGVAAFNKKCRESVWKYKAEWDRFTRQIGYWVDLKDPYITYETPYIESLWHIVSQFDRRKLLYHAHRVAPYCTRCGTTLSSHELGQPGAYKPVTDTSVYVKFQVLSSKLHVGGKKLPKNTFILAWTTTPWTLPGNVALAVGPNVRYVLARKGEEHFIIAEELANKVLGAPLAIEGQFTGKELVDLRYEPLFSVKTLRSVKSYRVHAADFVTTTDGTGIVHVAPMYGEDDYRLAVAAKLPMRHTVTEQGHFSGVSKELDGMYAKSGKAEEVILEKLKTDNGLLTTVPYEHEYPFCWRCETPLIYYAKDSWFIRTSMLNNELLANNAAVTWVPEHLKHGRFGQWLKEAKDWTFSRERYWGTPLPVWMSKDGKQRLVVSSLEDLDAYRARKANAYWLIRHGEAELIVAGIIVSGNGHSFALTSQGREQAARTAAIVKRKFGKKKPAAILASPLARTKETAEVIAKALGMKVTLDDRLREIQLGPTLENCHSAKYHEAYPTYEAKFAQRPPGGESLADLRVRMWSVLKDLEERYEGKDIIIVGHEYPLWMLTDAAQGWSMAESIAEKEHRGTDFIGFAEAQNTLVRNLPRNERGEVDLHRPYVDYVVLKKGGKLLRRVPEVCDVWFDSGSMPFAQWHWPFENDDLFRSQFPADFIAEGIDQTRGWFYLLLAVSTAQGLGAPYRTVLSYGHVLDEKGQKMSKSKGNVVKPDDVIDAVGVDAARWYFYTVNNPGDPKLFNMREVRERLTGFLGTLENCVKFWELYSHDVSARSFSHGDRPVHGLDRWVMSRLHRLIGEASARLDAYDPTGSARAIERFVVDDLSQWWLRRSRKRAEAFGLLRHVLLEVDKLIAPFIPFTAEDVHIRLHTGTSPSTESVHLHDWPAADAAMVDDALESEMVRVREFATAGLAVRKLEGIKVRQPLAAANIPGAELPEDLALLLKEELNVKDIRYLPAGESVSLETAITPELRAEGWVRETIRALQDMRKEAGLRVGQAATGWWHSDDESVTAAIGAGEDAIRREATLTQFLKRSDATSHTIEHEFELEAGRKLWLGIKK